MMRRNRLLLALVILVAASSQPVTAARAELTGTAKIAVVQDLTGPTSILGTPEKDAAVLAAEKINASGFLGSARIELVIEDSRGTKDGAVNAFQKVISRDNVLAIFGPTLTVQGFPAHPVAQKAGVPTVSASNVGKGITGIGEYIFVTSTPEYKLMIPNTAACVARTLKPKRVSVIQAKDQDWAVDATAAYEQALKAAGVVVAAVESFSTGETNFLAQLSKIKKTNPDAVIVNALFNESALIMSQAREIGIPPTVRFIGGVGFNNPKVPELAGEAAEGAIFGTTWHPTAPGSGSAQFLQDYRAKYRRDPDHFAAQAYDAILFLAHAIRKAGSTTERKAVRDAMATVNGVKGVLGESLNFDKERHLVAKPFVLTIEKRKFVMYRECL